MNQLEQFNKQLFEQWKTLPDNNLSYPLLISGNFKFKEKYPKIMYVGKEVNGWGNHFVIESVQVLEEIYQSFSTEINSNKTDLWKFIQDFYSYPQESNLLWTNALLCGKKKGTGTPTLSKKLKQMSISYLTFLYEYFKPDIIIIVCGNKNPYYRVITSFLNKIQANLHTYPTRENPLIMNEDETIFWTKHPSYLKVHSQTEVVRQQIKKKILK